MALRKSSKQIELVAKLVTGKKAPCVFCNREVDDEIIYGKLYVIGDIQCHYFCVLLASCLIQKGKDEEGLFGFLYKDILAEVERSKKHKCSYCNRGGATLGCSLSQCRKQFHLPCGRERNAISLFFGNYKSFCQNHAPKQKITSEIMLKVKARRSNICRKINSLTDDNTVKQEMDAVLTCAICYEEVQAFPSPETFWPPCCARDAWFHRSCLQRMALSAGMHYLKCPLCNDKDNFHKAVLSQGYYIPDRDAAWELEQNAFAEIYERNLSCNAEECKCPMGRNHDADNGPWEIRACLLCGSSGLHACCSLNEPDVAYVCATCRPAAPEDLDSLVKTVEAVIQTEENRSGERSRRGPVMPSRMSLRRTKRNLHLASSSSTDNFQYNNNEATDNIITSRRELNLKTPKRAQQSSFEGAAIKNIDSKLFSPIKLLEQGFREKITRTGLDFDLNEEVLEEMRRRFKKPRPLSEKRKIVNNIVSGVFDNILKEPKQKEAVKEWCSPKKTGEVIEEMNEEVNDYKIRQEEEPGESEQIQKVLSVDSVVVAGEDIVTSKTNDTQAGELNMSEGNVDDGINSSSTFQGPSESVTEENNHNLPVSDTLNNINTVHLEKSEKDQGDIDIDKEAIFIDEDMRISEMDNHGIELDGAKHVGDNSGDDSSSTFQLPPEFIAEGESDNSLPVLNTPMKLKTFDIEKGSSLEISENDNQVVNIDVVKMKANCDDISDLTLKSPFKMKKCALIFNPLDKEALKNHNMGIDMECFKNYYLNEVDKGLKCNNTTNNIINIIENDSSNIENNIVKEKKKGVKRRKRIKEVNGKKRKTDCNGETGEKVTRHRKRNMETDKLKLTFESGRRCNQRRRCKDNKIKIKLSLNNVIQIKVKRKQQLKLKISEVKNNRKTINNSMKYNKPVLKQYILNPTKRSTNEMIVKPEKEVTPPKRKYIKHEKVSDNLIQTSLTKFFTTKNSEEYHDT